MQKLEHYGVRGIALNWFSSYLTGRTQYTSCNNERSDMKTITCGVPQGSVLGLLLFLLYINDLPNISNKLKFYLFADDTNIFYKGTNLKSIQKTVNHELKKLSLWLNANRLALNISKTNFVIFAARNKPLENVTLLINRKAIQQADNVKYLGVLIDAQLTFKNHISSVIKKVSRITGLMYKIRNFVDNKTLDMISLIYPHLLYGIPLWGSACKSLIDPLQILQNQAVRLISNKHKNIHTLYELPKCTMRTIFDNSSNLLNVSDDPPMYWYVYTFTKVSSNPLFADLGILKVKDIYRLSTLKFVYSSINKTNPNQFHYFYNPINHNYDTIANRNNRLVVPMTRTSSYGLKSLKYDGCIMWNETELSVRNAHSFSSFSNLTKRSLLNSYKMLEQI